MSNVKIIDLDAIIQDSLVFTLKGKKHELKPVSFKDFVENMKDLQQIGKSPSIEEELSLTKRLMIRAFPSLTDDDIDNLTMVQMQTIVKAAQDFNGQAEGEKEAKAEAEKQNPPQAA